MEESVKWFRMAAESGDYFAACNLAHALKDGDGFAIDLVKSFKWFKVAAEGGFADAQWQLSKRIEAVKE